MKIPTRWPKREMDVLAAHWAGVKTFAGISVTETTTIGAVGLPATAWEDKFRKSPVR